MKENILWIDDIPALDSGADYKKMTGDHFGKYKDNVKLIRKFYRDAKHDKKEDPTVCDDLLGYIDDNINDIDCVVLDINLEKAISQKRFLEMAEHFSGGGVALRLKDEKTIETFEQYDLGDMKENGGFYLYRYLINKGFPKDRIFVFSAYADTKKDGWERVFRDKGDKFPLCEHKDSNHPSAACEKAIDDELGLYSGENEYYLVRWIVFSAIEYYKIKLNNNEITLAPFNGNMKKELTNVEIYEIFKNIKHEFHRESPSNYGNVYTDALNRISGPFEANYKRKLSYYQKVTKTLRNWLAHNKFDSVPNQNEFLILFIVALRSYFGADFPVQDFEKATFNLGGNSLHKVTEAEREVYNGLLNSNSEKGSYNNYLYYIVAEGKDENKKCYYKDLLNALWEYLYSPKHGKSIDFCDKLMTAIEAEVFRDEATATNPDELSRC